MPTVTEKGLFATWRGLWEGEECDRTLNAIKIGDDVFYRAYSASFFDSFDANHLTPCRFVLRNCWLKVGAPENARFEKLWWEDEVGDLPPVDPICNQPRLMFDGPIHLDNVPLVDDNTGIGTLSQVGGFLQPVTVRLTLQVPEEVGESIEDNPTDSRSVQGGIMTITSSLVMLAVVPSLTQNSVNISELYEAERKLFDSTPDSLEVYLHPNTFTIHRADGPASGTGEPLYVVGQMTETAFVGSEPSVSYGFLGSDVRSFKFNDFGFQKNSDYGSWVSDYAFSMTGSIYNVLCDYGEWSHPKTEKP